MIPGIGLGLPLSLIFVRKRNVENPNPNKTFAIESLSLKNDPLIFVRYYNMTFLILTDCCTPFAANSLYTRAK